MGADYRIGRVVAVKLVEQRLRFNGFVWGEFSLRNFYYRVTIVET